MNRALTLALTVALIGGLAFMGAAGTAAATDDGQSNDADIDQDQRVAQGADVSSEDSWAIAVDFGDKGNGDGPTANTGNEVKQTSDNHQNADIYQDNENIEDSLFVELGGL
ncbi:hypothetical protein A6E15_04640 [Natrinema saccharevitans]|uniref:Uncharacterized protein n=1 Tax=Natrinema saccharevitans TaxID=301967 RepID=A0A1S8AU22_9EURY|nr:hypothetical protein [Natrinema saccharevitans]OLZ40313.1 hypothetical protein A6E15_04640 [Natrinema saccharevitans]